MDSKFCKHVRLPETVPYERSARAWSPAEEENEKSRIDNYKRVTEKLKQFFGERTVYELSCGYNAGETIGRLYNEFFGELGYADMEQWHRTAAPALGPKLKIRSDWKKIASVGEDTLYAHKTLLLVLSVYQGDRKCRTVFFVSEYSATA